MSAGRKRLLLLFYSLVHRTPSLCTVVAALASLQSAPPGATRVRAVPGSAAAAAPGFTNLPLLPNRLVSATGPPPRAELESRLLGLLKMEQKRNQFLNRNRYRKSFLGVQCSAVLAQLRTANSELSTLIANQELLFHQVIAL